MPAERLRPASLNRRHNPQLREVQVPRIDPPIGWAVCSKDVSDLQFWARQRPDPSLWPSILKLRQQLVGAVSVPDKLCRDMSVLGRRAELGVAQ